MSAAAPVLTAHIALLSLISFGGVPGVLPDLHRFVLVHGWMSDQEFADCFAIVQALPGPNIILLMAFVGWKVGGLPAAGIGALASFVPSCSLAYIAFGWWERFRHTIWQRRVRHGLAPVVIGLVMAGGYVMARTTPGSVSTAVALIAAAATPGTRLSPLWLIAAGAVLGAAGFV